MEQSFVAWAKMRAMRLPQVKLGIGDDAAVLEAGNDDWVVTTDSLMEGVHFESQKISYESIGRKLVNVNFSDLAAMAAEPVAIFLSMCIPLKEAAAADVIAAEVFEGICDAASKEQVALAGGDTNCWDGPLALHLTAIGHTVAGRVWVRSGARPDDLVLVTGPLGGSIQGKHYDFTPRFDLARQLREVDGIHAAMDISDGLSVDLLRMCDASGCGAILELDQVPISEAAKQLATDSDKLPVEHALGDGEDFELLLAVAEDRFAAVVEAVGPEHAIRCGKFTSRTGLWMREGAKIRQLASTGYVHGR